MTDTKFTPITYIAYQRVTHEEMNYIQTQRLKAERVRIVSEFPSDENSTAGDIIFLDADNKFYGYNGSDWRSIGDANLPLPSEDRLLIDSTNYATARFDLSNLTNGSYRIYELPDGDGMIALLSDVPVVTGDTTGAILYYGVDQYDIQSNSEVITSEDSTKPYIKMVPAAARTGDIIDYEISVNNPRFKVQSDGRTIVKRLAVFSGTDG